MRRVVEVFTKSRFVINYKRMWPYLKPIFPTALLGLLLTIPVGSMDAVIASFMKPLMDDVLIGKQTSFLKLLPFIIVGFTFVQGTLNYIATYISKWTGLKISTGLKRDLYKKLLSMNTSYFDKVDSGTVVFRFLNDADSASSGLVQNLKSFLSKLFSSLFLIAVLIYNSWQLAIVAVLVLGLAIYPIKLVHKMIKEIMKKTVGAGAEAYKIYYETFGGNRVIHSYTLENHLGDKFNDITSRMFILGTKMTKGSAWLSPLMHFIGSIGVALVVGMGSYLIINGTITAGNFVAFIAALIMLYTPLKSIGDNYVSLHLAFLAIERVFNVFGMGYKIVESPDAIELKDVKKGLEFRNVNFAYVPGNNVLQGINLFIESNKTVALVGNSGGGKTTIGALIPRLYEVEEGEILIDDVNIKNYTIESLRRNIAIVFQDNFLFSGTIKENVALGREGCNDEEIWKALENAYLKDFVDSLPNKLDTEIGERGILLSGGQKQRVGIARAFIKDAPIVILDEATSALDNVAEKVVQDALENLMKERTVIIIAHRLSTIQNADEIIVLQEGSILERGNHCELVSKNGVYAQMYQANIVK